MRRTLIWALGAILLTACSPKVDISVDAGSIDRQDCIACVELDEDCAYYDTYRLTEDNGSTVKSDVMSVDGKTMLYFRMPGSTPAGSTRHFTFAKGKPGPGMMEMYVAHDKNSLTLYDRDGRPMLTYNYAEHQSPEGVRPIFNRSGYIHPAYTPSGFVYTNIQPEDHRHHYGIWNPWTRVEYDGQVYDLWNLGDSLGTVRAKEVKDIYAGPVVNGFDASLEHVAFTPEGEKVIMEEDWIITAASTADGYVWDFKSILKPCTDKPVTIKAYRYQGFSCRATAEWTNQNSSMMTSEGLERPEIDQTRADWIYVNGANGENATAGFMYMSCPDNYDSPEQLRIWDQNANGGRGDVYVNFNPAKSVDWVLEPGGTYTLDYRVVAYDGEMTPQKAAALWQDYINPPKAYLD